MKHAKLLFLLITALAFVSCSSSNDERRRRYNLSLSHFQELHILMCLFFCIYYNISDLAYWNIYIFG